MSEFCVLIVTVPDGVSSLAATALVSNNSMEVIAACKGCVKKKVVVIDQQGVEALALSSITSTPGGDMYVLRFPNVDSAGIWFEQNKRQIVGATVQLFDPALSF